MRPIIQQMTHHIDFETVYLVPYNLQRIIGCHGVGFAPNFDPHFCLFKAYVSRK